MNAHVEAYRMELETRFDTIKNAIAWYVNEKFGRCPEREDLIQEAFCFVWSHLGEWNPAKSNLATYACGGARLACLSYLRKRSRTVPTVAIGTAESDGWQHIKDTRNDSAEQTRHDILTAVIESLEGEEKTVVIERLNGKTFPEIASRYGYTRQRWENVYADAIAYLKGVMS